MLYMPENSPSSPNHNANLSHTATDIAYIAAFAALIIVLGAVSIPIGTAGVPIAMQNFGILLTAILLGMWRGGLTTVLFLGVGLLGVPNLSGWNPTISAIAGPTVGYLVGYLISAFFVGGLAQLAPKQTSRSANTTRFMVFIGAGVIGVFIQYLCGTIGLMVRLGMDFQAACAVNLPFIPGDALKIFFAAAISTAVIKAVPQLLPVSRRA